MKCPHCQHEWTVEVGQWGVYRYVGKATFWYVCPACKQSFPPPKEGGA